MRHTHLAALLLAATLAPRVAAAQTWLFESAHTLPSTDTGWGAITLEPGDATHPARLFIARRDDGLLAWDPGTATGPTVDDSKGANAVILAPPAGRAYAVMTDGTLLTFDLRTLKPFGRTDLGPGALRTGFYEPTQNHVHIITANEPEKGGEKTTWITLDAASGQVLGRTEFNSHTMDTPAVDDHGAIYAPMRTRRCCSSSTPRTWH